MPRYALKVAYDGTRFHGSQRQPGLRTVEGDLLQALVRIGAITDPDSSWFLTASRTDGGVSAAGNVFALSTGFRGDSLGRAVNAYLQDMRVIGVREVPDHFHPRRSWRRRYRYHLRRGGFDEEAFRATVAVFRGTHDFTGFSRARGDLDPVRAVDEVSVTEAGPYLDVEFAGPSFLWNQVRRMVSAGLAVARGEATREDVVAVLERRSTRDLGLAPPEPLVLLDVLYDFPFPPDPRLLGRAWEEERLAAALRLAVLEDLRGGGGA